MSNQAPSNYAGKVAFIDKKFVDYEFVEQRTCLLTGQYTGNQLVPNQRCYFGPNTKLIGKRIVGIEMLSIGQAGSPVVMNGAQILFASNFRSFVLTMLNKSKEEVVKHYPINDLYRVNNSGKTRIFNIPDADIENSYIAATATVVFVAEVNAVLNFYTVSW